MNDRVTDQHSTDLLAVLARSAAGDAELQQPRAGLSLPQRKLLTLVDGKSSLATLAEVEPALHLARLGRDAAVLVRLGLVTGDGALLASSVSSEISVRSARTMSPTSPASSTSPTSSTGATSPANSSNTAGSTSKPATLGATAAKRRPATAPTPLGPMPMTAPPTTRSPALPVVAGLIVLGAAGAGYAIFSGDRNEQAPSTASQTTAPAPLPSPISAQAPVPAPSVPSPAAAVTGATEQTGIASALAPASVASAPGQLNATQAQPVANAPGAGVPRSPPTPPGALPTLPVPTRAAATLPAATLPAATLPAPTPRPATVVPPAAARAVPAAATESAALPSAAGAAAPPPPVPPPAVASTVPAAAAVAPVASIERPLQPVRRVEPAFPVEALRQGVDQGTVMAQLRVGADGRVEAVTTNAIGTSRVFERAARAALTEWSFPPGSAGRLYQVQLDFRR